MRAALLALLLALPADPRALVGLLGDPALETREQAQKALEEKGEEARAALEEGARHADPEVASRSKAALEAIRAERRASALRGVELELVPAARTLKAGEELRYSIRLRNAGKAPVLLLRATPGSRHSLKPPRLVSEFKNSEGLSLRHGVRPPQPPRPCFLEAGDFLELKPGEEAEIIAEKDCVGLTPTAAGRFSITLDYSIDGPFPCRDKEVEALCARLVPGQVRSKPVEIEVAP